MRLPSTRAARARAAVGLTAAGALAVAACNEHFVTGPERAEATLDVSGWRDTLVVGEQGAPRVRVLDARGREVVGAAVSWQVAASGALDARLNGRTALPAGTAVDAASTVDSLQLTALRTGTARFVVTLTDPRFTVVQLPRTATVVVGGVGVTTAHDTTVTAVGDTALVAGTAFGRAGTGAALAPRAGQGLTWTRRGPGAVTLVGTGDSVRAVATAAGTDTLVATHALCLAGARCADTTVVHVAQRGALALPRAAFRVWSFGDSVAPPVVLQDARGNAIAGARLEVVPVSAADSALVEIGTAPAAPAAGALRAARAAAAPIVLVAHAAAPGGAAFAAAPSAAASASAAALAVPPIIARGNGTARVAVRGLAPSGAVLASDTVTVIVRQVAVNVSVFPAFADLTPGDSVPVRFAARDARGHAVADAQFVPAADVVDYADGGVRAPLGAAGRTGAVLARVVGPAAFESNPGATVPPVRVDTAHVAITAAPPVPATSQRVEALTAAVRDSAGRPMAGRWVRFTVPAGRVDADSVLTDQAGVAHATWTMPTTTGSYTATAVLLGEAAPGTTPGTARADSAGRIVLRKTLGVQAGAASRLAVAVAPPAAAQIGVPFTAAPVVQLTDDFGNPVAQGGVTVTVALGAGGGTLGGSVTAVTDAQGRATFPGLRVVGGLTPRPVVFSAPGATAQPSAPITFSAGAPDPAHTTVTRSGNPGGVASQDTVLVTVTPRDVGGNPVGAGHAVTVALDTAAGTSTGAVDPVVDRGDGTYTARVVAARAGTPAPLRVSVNGAPVTGVLPSLAVLAAAPAQLALAATPPDSAALGTPLATVPAVQLMDAHGNPVAQAGVSVTVTLAPATAAITGPATVLTDATGRAEFPGLAVRGTPGARAFTFGGTGLATHAATPTTFVAGAPDPALTTVVLAHTAVASGDSTRVTVTPRDADGNLVGARHTVAVTLAGGAGLSTAAYTSNAHDQQDGTYTVSLVGVLAGSPTAVGARVDGVAVTSAVPSLTVQAGAPAQVAVVAGNRQSAAGGTPVAVAPAVRVTDAAGNRVPGATVTFAVATGGGTLTGATPTTDGQGLATLGGWTLGATGGSQLVTATAGAAPPAAITATAFSAGTPTVVMVQDSLRLVTLGAVTPAVTVEAVVRDGFGQLVTDTAQVAWTSTAPGAVRIDSTGVRPDGTHWAALTGLARSTTTRVVAAHGAARDTAKAVVIQQAASITTPPSLSALGMGQSVDLAVTAADANGNPLPRGDLTFESSDTTVARVDATGKVRGVGPGSATITVRAGGVSTTAVAVSGNIAYADFCSIAGLNISGSTQRAGCALRLTPALGNQSGGVWQPVKQKLNNGFESVMRFKITSPGNGGADGIALVIQSTSNTATGQSGGGIGYPGLTKALAVELDTYDNGELNGNHVAVQSCGVGAITAAHNTNTAGSGCTWGGQVNVPFNLKDGAEHTMRVVYTPGTLRVYFDGSSTATVTASITLTNVKGQSILDAQGKAWIGFTSATGGSWNNHDILSWSLTPSP